MNSEKQKPTTDKYRNNFDLIFGEEEEYDFDLDPTVESQLGEIRSNNLENMDD